MALDMASTTQVDMVVRPDEQIEHPEPLTAIAVCVGGRWAALCRELDIASEGETSLDAVWNLKAAVREALAVAREQNLKDGFVRVPDQALVEFMSSHQGPGPLATFAFTVRD